MAYGWRGARSGIAQGWSAMDDYYNRKEGRARAGRLDREDNRRWNIQNERNEMSAGFGNELKQRQIQAYDDEEIANTWASTMHDQDGKPVDFTKLDSNQLKTKKSQIMSVMNKSPSLRAQLASNPNVDPENPLANMDFIYDQKTKKPSAVFSLRMRDGSIKPMTELRSDAEDDGVVIMPLSDLDSQVSAMVGSRGAMGARRKATAEMATEARQFGRDKTLARIKSSKASSGIKHGTARDVIREGKNLDMYGEAKGITEFWDKNKGQGGSWVSRDQWDASYGGEAAPAAPDTNAAPTDPQAYFDILREDNGEDVSDEEINEEIRKYFPNWKKSAKSALKKDVKEKPAAKKSSFMDANAAEKPDTVKKKPKGEVSISDARASYDNGRKAVNNAIKAKDKTYLKAYADKLTPDYLLKLKPKQRTEAKSNLSKIKSILGNQSTMMAE